MKTKSLILTAMLVLFQANTLSFAATDSTGKDGKRQNVAPQDGIVEVKDIVLPGTLEVQDPPKKNVIKKPPQTSDIVIPPTKPIPPPPVKNLPVNTDTHQITNYKGGVVPSTNQGSVPVVNRPTQTNPSYKGSVAPSTDEGSKPVVVPPAPAPVVPVSVSGKGSAAPSNNPGVVPMVDASLKNAVEASAPAPKPIPVPKVPLETQNATLDTKLEEQPLQDLNTFISASKSNPTKNACEDKALGDIYKLLLSDNNNVLGIMFELTAMRLAKRTLEQQPDSKYGTFEDLAVNEIEKLNKQVDKLDKDKTVQDQVRKVYETYGKSDDNKVVSDHFDDMKRDASDAAKRAADACYFDKEKRFKNNEASAFIMAAVIGEGGDLSASTKDNPAKLTDVDAATIWVVERTRAEAAKTNPDYKIGGKNGNMLNVSTRVTRYLGRIAGGRKELSPSEMEGLIEKEQKQISDVVKGIFDDTKSEAKNNIQKELRTCLKVANPNCEDCQITDKVNSLETVNLDVDRIQRGLLETVAKSDNLKVEKDLRAKLGPMYLDFNSIPNPDVKVKVQTAESDQDLGHDFAKDSDAAPGTTAVPKLPPRGTKEICKKFWVNKPGSKRTKGRAVAKHARTASKKAVAHAPVAKSEEDSEQANAPASAPVSAPAAVTQPAASQAVVKQTKSAPKPQDKPEVKEAPAKTEVVRTQFPVPPAAQTVAVPPAAGSSSAGSVSGVKAMTPENFEYVNRPSTMGGLDPNLDTFLKGNNAPAKKKDVPAAREPSSTSKDYTTSSQAALAKLATPGDTSFSWGACTVTRTTQSDAAHTITLNFKSKKASQMNGVDKVSEAEQFNKAAEMCGYKSN